MRPSHHIMEVKLVNWYPLYIVVMVKSEKPVYKLRQWLGMMREVARPDRSHKHEYGELPAQDKELALEHRLSILQNGAPVFQAHGLSVGISRLHMFLMSIFQCLVQHTRCNLVGSSCWGDVWCFQKRVCFTRYCNTCLNQCSCPPATFSKIFCSFQGS